ncbi:starch synthase [Andreprevotia lacus DSM 23236]|jgi:starch synthase|uniref:Glycogen synthase n=1 Tax=Andreprevotia lacus DSM 23236 TaxID=1121001 RepID=A0A1W1X7M2_9NEIS|nr:glycogen synthase GlgA [Andreprevotia lacus]SMC19833.1 starch synthase [Andreprevotia lacus DSM 23236]
MRVLHVCSELFPLLKTGGLADVTGALPGALAGLGVDVRLLLPGFPAIKAGLPEEGDVAQLDTPFGHVRLVYSHLPGSGAGVYVIDAPQFYDRPGNPYQDDAQQPYGDNHRRFALLGWLAAELASGLDPYWRPEVVHGHDWHAGLAPAYLAARGRPARSVLTVHNLAYQGLFPADAFGELGLPADFFDIEGLEFHGKVSFLKAGLYYADHITTVSPTYAHEITTEEQGCGLNGLLRDRGAQLSGVLNGVDDAVWNPATDVLIAASYTADKPAGKAKCKQALQEALGLATDSDGPLFAVVSRITEQKGLHLILDTLDEIVSRGGQFVLLGSGDPDKEAAFVAKAAANPQQVAVRIGYDEDKSHRVMAGADVIMVPSRFEPCGLTQLYGLKYGALPLVRKVGGLADTVVDVALENLADETATGFVFNDFTAADLTAGIRRAFALWAKPQSWKTVRRSAMRRDFGWQAAAHAYTDLYTRLLAA